MPEIYLIPEHFEEEKRKEILIEEKQLVKPFENVS